MKKRYAGLLLSGMLALSGCAGQTPDEGSTETGQPKETETQEASTIELDYQKGIADGVYGWTLSEDESYYMLSAIDENGEPVESELQQGFMGGGMRGQGGGMRGPGGNPQEQGDNNAQGKPQEEKSPDDNAAQDAPKEAQEAGSPNGTVGQDTPDMPQEAGSPDDTATQGAPDGGEMTDPLAMEANQQAMAQSVNALGVYTESNITNKEYQTMLVFVPAEYMTLDEDGNASFTEASVGGYTAETAPIVFQNGNGGWRSGAPKAPEYADALKAGMVYVSCGSRSRDASGEDGTPTGKAPTPVADLKAGVIAVRANADVIPGDKDKMISVGASGGGQMSSALGATGNMEAYYPYLYEAGAIGVTYDEATDTYQSEYDDSVYAAMCYCPIADIDNADLAYAWFRYDSTKNEDGTINLRSGSFYDVTLQNISDALNAMLATQDDPEGYLSDAYGDTSEWLQTNADGTYTVTDLAKFITGTNLVRNKDIPGFDVLDLSAENDAFGKKEDTAVHFSASIAGLLQDNYEEYAKLDGFDAEQVDAYIDNALTGEEAAYIADQTYLVNGTRIMLDVAAGTQTADIAKYWRTRNGTAATKARRQAHS